MSLWVTPVIHAYVVTLLGLFYAYTVTFLRISGDATGWRPAWQLALRVPPVVILYISPVV